MKISKTAVLYSIIGYTLIISLFLVGCGNGPGGENPTYVLEDPVITPAPGGTYTTDVFQFEVSAAPGNVVRYSYWDDGNLVRFECYEETITLLLLEDDPDEKQFTFYISSFLEEDESVYSGQITAIYNLRRPPAPPTDRTFWGSWMGVDGSDEWYISGRTVTIDDEVLTYRDADEDSITFSDMTLELIAPDVLKVTEDGRSIPDYLYRVAGAESNISLNLAYSGEEVPQSRISRGIADQIAQVGGFQAVITNLNNPLDEQTVESEAGGEIIAEGIIIGDEYQVAIQAEDDLAEDVISTLLPLFDGQEMGTLDLDNDNANFKMNIRSYVRPDLLFADGETRYWVYIDFENIGSTGIGSPQYSITSIDDLEITDGETSGILLEGTMTPGRKASVGLRVRCPEIEVEDVVKKLRVEVSDSYGLFSRGEELSLPFYRKNPSFYVYFNPGESEAAALVKRPGGAPVALSTGSNRFNMELGEWLVLCGGSGDYTLGVLDVYNYEGDVISDPDYGEPNNTEETASLLSMGQSVTSYSLGSEDVDFYSFEITGINTLVYDANGAVSGGTPLTRTYETGAEVTIEGNEGALVKDDALFAGWSLSPDGTTGFGSTGLSETVTIGEGENLVYAVWVPKAEAVGINATLLADGTLWKYNQTDSPLLTEVDFFYDKSTNGYRIYAIKTDGTLWVYGSGSFGQLGTAEQALENPVQVDPGNTGAAITKVLFDDNTTFFLNENGVLYGCGYNDGPLPTGLRSWGSTPMEFLTDVEDFAIGDDFVIALREIDGVKSAWTVGGNSAGQLGDGTTSSRNTPAVVPGFESGVDSVAAGWVHSLILMEDGRLFGFGSNTSEQLGNESHLTEESYSTPLLMKTGCSSVFAGYSQTFLIDQFGSVYSTGASDYGILGRPDTGLWSEVPLFISDVEFIHSDRNYATYYHLGSGDLYFSGRRQYGGGSTMEPELLQEDAASFMPDHDDKVRVVGSDGVVSVYQSFSTTTVSPAALYP